MQEALQRFFAGKTKLEILERAVADRLLIAPCQTPRDLRENAHLAARTFWVEVPYPDGRTVTHPGPYVKLSETPISYRRRRAAPWGAHRRVAERGPQACTAAATAALRPTVRGAARPRHQLGRQSDQ